MSASGWTGFAVTASAVGAIVMAGLGWMGYLLSRGIDRRSQEQRKAEEARQQEQWKAEEARQRERDLAEQFEKGRAYERDLHRPRPVWEVNDG